MTTWCALYQWFECPTPAVAARVHARLMELSPSRRGEQQASWALRVGHVGRSLLQAEVVLEQGYDATIGGQVRDAVPEARVVVAGPAYGVLAEDGPSGAFFPAFNYVFCPRRPELNLRAIADRIGGDASIQSFGSNRVLCLRRPIRFRASRRSWKFTEADSRGEREMTLVEALAHGDASLAGGRTSLVLGLRTPEHGCVHLAELTIQIDAAAQEWHGHAHLQVSGAHNALVQPRQSGPSTWVFQGRTPRVPALSDVDWPY